MRFGKKKIFLMIIVAFVCVGAFLGMNHTGRKIKVSYDPNEGSSKISTKLVQSQKGKTLQKVLEDNGYNIDKELYQYSVSLSTPSTKVKTLKIKKRANGVITIGKKKIKYNSAKKSISGLLKEKNIKVNKDDIVSPGLSTALTTNVKKVNIIRVTKTQIASTEEVPYQTEVVANGSVAQGSTKVEQNGSNGKKEVVSEAVYHNGVLVSQKTKSSTVTVQPTSMKVSMNPTDIAASAAQSNNSSTSSASEEDSSSSDSNNSNISKTSTTDTSSSTSTEDSSNDSKSNSSTENNSSSNSNASSTNSNSSSDSSQASSTTQTNNSSSSANSSSTSNQESSDNTNNTKTETNTNSGSESTTDDKTTTKTVTSTVAIPHQSYNVYVSNLEKGKTQITTQGVDGEKTVTTEMTYKGDQLVSQKVVSEVVTKQPVTEVVAVGTKEEAATSSQTNTSSSTSSQSSTNSSSSSQSSNNSTSTSTTGYSFSQYVSQTKNITYNNKTENLSASDLDLLCAVVAQEDNSSYEGAFAVVSCIMNRVDSGKWGGSTAIAVVKAKGQFSAYSSGAYKKYLNGKAPSYVQAAVKDCVYGGVRNHKYLSFQASKKSNSVKIGGNYYQ